MHSFIFKRFIDDIIWISQGEKLTNSIKEKLTSTFREGGLELIFREISTQEPAGSCVEFLDVNHRIDDCAPGGFVTTDYIKPTARGRVFLNGGSFHPTHVFRSIVFGEAIRMRRLNELQQNYIDQWFSNLSEVSNPTGVMQAYIEPLIITRSGSRKF